MDNLFTWLIIIGAVVSLINKASGKNNQKPGVNQQNRPNQNPMNRPTPNRPNQYQNPMSSNKQMPDSIQRLMNGLQQAAQTGNPQMKPSVKPSVSPEMARPTINPNMAKPTVITQVSPTQGIEGMMVGETVIPEGQNFGEGFADEEGTSFGDGLKGTEGECDEDHGEIEFQRNTPQVTVEDRTPWNFSGENLMTAFVYSEILNAPKCRKQHGR